MVDSIAKFTKRDWKNFGLFFVVLGLIALFILKKVDVGLGFLLVGILLLFILKIKNRR